jgi:hypothetical protein
MSAFNKARGCFTVWVDVEEVSPDSDIPSIYNYEEALKTAQTLDRKYHHKRAVCVSEFGQFRSNNKPRSEFLEIWWNPAYEGSREPKSRGYGFYVPDAGRKRWVEYEPVLSLGPPDEDFDENDIEPLVDPAGDFTVKDEVDEDEPIWTDFSDYDSALFKAKELALDSTHSVSICERATFEVDGETKNEILEFWWRDSAGSDRGFPFRGRGIGLAIRKDTSRVFVRYTPSSPTVDEEDLVDDLEVDASSTDSDEYVKTHCEDCGKIMPLYEKFEYEYEEEVGRSSGSARVGRSSHRRSLSTGKSSYSSGSSSSYSTGRTYYATRKLVLCEDCYTTRIKADEEADKWTIGDWITIIVGLIVLAGAGLLFWSLFRH